MLDRTRLTFLVSIIPALLFASACAHTDRTPVSEAASVPTPEAAPAATKLVRPRYAVGAALARPDLVPYVSHRGSGAFANYVAVQLPYEPAAALKAQVESGFSVRLRSRGEAHLTVITPPEFHDALSSRLTIDEIDAMAAEDGLQRAAFEIECLGQATALVEGRRQSTFYVLLRAPAARAFRARVGAEFRKRGGLASQFDADLYFPHITIGFTQRDLHYEDGARKDASTCVADLIPSAMPD